MRSTLPPLPARRWIGALVLSLAVLAITACGEDDGTGVAVAAADPSVGADLELGAAAPSPFEPLPGAPVPTEETVPTTSAPDPDTIPDPNLPEPGNEPTGSLPETDENGVPYCD